MQHNSFVLMIARQLVDQSSLVYLSSSSSFIQHSFTIYFLYYSACENKCSTSVIVISRGLVIIQASSIASALIFFASCSVNPNSLDRKSTRLNSSHVSISYAVFCLKKKNKSVEQVAVG